MSRIMIQDKTQLKIVEHIIIKNFWEYFIIDRVYEDPDIKEAVVYGFETELGDVSMEEIKPYIRSRTTNLKNIMPAPGWAWKEKKKCN